jgi:hypothetical protein
MANQFLFSYICEKKNNSNIEKNIFLEINSLNFLPWHMRIHTRSHS